MKQLTRLLCIFFCFIAGPIAAGVDYVVLQLAGLACPFCNTHVIRVLEQTPGANYVQTDLAVNQVHFYWDSDYSFQPWYFCSVVKRAGYDLVSVYVCASGQIKKNGDQFILTSCDDSICYELCYCDHIMLPDNTSTIYSVCGYLGWDDGGHIYLQVDEVGECD